MRGQASLQVGETSFQFLNAPGQVRFMRGIGHCPIVTYLGRFTAPIAPEGRLHLSDSALVYAWCRPRSSRSCTARAISSVRAAP